MPPFGFVAELAQTAKTALSVYKEFLANQPFGLILIDTGLPDMEGTALAEQIREVDPSQYPPVIMMSAFNTGAGEMHSSLQNIFPGLLKAIRQI